jgi:hypothetical protein
MTRGHGTYESQYDDEADLPEGTVLTDPTVCPHGIDDDGFCPICDDGENACPGPAGFWPCALEFGHGGDHERVGE